MRIKNKLLTAVLAVSLIAASSMPAFAAKSPTQGIAPDTTKSYTDVNSWDHKSKTVTSIVKNQKATVIKVKTNKKSKGVTFRIARDKNGNKIPITKIGDGKKGVFNNKTGRKITKVHVKAKTATIAKNAFKGSKVKTINLYGKTTIKKGAFSSTKQKQVTIRIKGAKKKASAFTFKKGAFNGLNAKSKIIVNKKTMTKKEFQKLKKAAKRAGFKGTITRK